MPPARTSRATAPDRFDIPRIYELIRQRGSIGDRLVEIEFEDADAEGFAFTFG